MLIVTLIMFIISTLALFGILLPSSIFTLLLILVLGSSLVLRKYLHDSYFRESFFLLLTGAGIYLCRLFIFWTILQALGTPVSFKFASYFAIITNILAQIPITPGNIGVREAVFALISPLLALSSSIGVLIGAIFQVLRLILYSMLMFVVDLWDIHDRKSRTTTTN